MTGVTSLGHRGNNMAGGVEPRATGSALLENEKKKEKKERKDEAAPLSRGHDGNCGSTGRPATAESSSSSSSRSPAVMFMFGFQGNLQCGGMVGNGVIMRSEGL